MDLLQVSWHQPGTYPSEILHALIGLRSARSRKPRRDPDFRTQSSPRWGGRFSLRLPTRSVLSVSVSGSCSQSKLTEQTGLLFSNISIRAVIHSIRIRLTVESLGIFKAFCAVFVGCSGLQRGFPLAPHLLVVFQPASVGLETMPLALVNDRHR